MLGTVTVDLQIIQPYFFRELAVDYSVAFRRQSGTFHEVVNVRVVQVSRIAMCIAQSSVDTSGISDVPVRQPIPNCCQLLPIVGRIYATCYLSIAIVGLHWVCTKLQPFGMVP